MRSRLFGILLIVVFTSQLWAQDRAQRCLDSMTLEEKIAQIMIIRSFAQGDSAYFAKISSDIQTYQYGGVCFFKGSPSVLVQARSRYQQVSKIPLWFSIDGEWGVSMRIDSVPIFPKQQTLGAIRNDSLIELMGFYVGEQCRRLGIHQNYLPCVDVNSNPQNPVINARSFGEDPRLVAHQASVYLRGLHRSGVMGSAKHFPGHGNTDVDSHEALPILSQSMDILNQVDLLPFRRMIEEQVGSIMVGHLLVKAYDPHAASVSSRLIDTLLRQELGYKGLIITDALEMNGIATKTPGEIELAALKAGVDQLLLPADPALSIAYMAKAIRKGEYPEAEIDRRCLKILRLKDRLGLFEESAPSPENLIEDLQKVAYHRLIERLYSEAITLVKNQDHLIPINPERSLLHIQVGYGDTNDRLAHHISAYGTAETIALSRDFDSLLIDSLYTLSQSYDMVLLSTNNTNIQARRQYGITPQTIKLIDRLSESPTPLIWTLFASPYALNFVKNLDSIEAILIAYHEVPEAQEAAAHALYGAADMGGRLGVSTGTHYGVGDGIDMEAQQVGTINQRWKDHPYFSPIDSILNQAIADSVFPGVQVLVLKNDRLVYQKSVGRYTYDPNSRAVNDTTLYDLASLTKILSTSLALMKLYEMGMFQFDDPISKYISGLNKDKGAILISELMAHQSGLAAGLPEPVRHKRAMIRSINHLELQSKTYLYSDINALLLGYLVESLSEQSLDAFCEQYFYRPMGLKHLCFEPLRHFELDRIAPTECREDGCCQGEVHDPTVVKLGGVGGSAGLFGNALDVAQIMQMLVNKGFYKQHRLLNAETIELFTRRTFMNDNRRAALFDRPLDRAHVNGPCAMSASASSYGHLGFTGTMAWADPEHGLVYVFLSNRVYPSAQPNRLSEKNLRSEIQQWFYQYLPW